METRRHITERRAAIEREIAKLQAEQEALEQRKPGPEEQRLEVESREFREKVNTLSEQADTIIADLDAIGRDLEAATNAKVKEEARRRMDFLRSELACLPFVIGAAYERYCLGHIRYLAEKAKGEREHRRALQEAELAIVRASRDRRRAAHLARQMEMEADASRAEGFPSTSTEDVTLENAGYWKAPAERQLQRLYRLKLWQVDPETAQARARTLGKERRALENQRIEDLLTRA